MIIKSDYDIVIKECSKDKRYWTAYISLRDTNNMSFSITTIPNQLIITGDAGNFIIGGVSYERVLDIFNSSYPKYDYWVSKVLAGESTKNVRCPINESIFNIIYSYLDDTLRDELKDNCNKDNLDKILSCLDAHSNESEYIKNLAKFLEELMTNSFINTSDTIYNIDDIADEIICLSNNLINDEDFFGKENIISLLSKIEISYNYKYICDCLNILYDSILIKIKEYVDFSKSCEKDFNDRVKYKELYKIEDILYTNLYKALSERVKVKRDTVKALNKYKRTKEELSKNIQELGLHYKGSSRTREISYFRNAKSNWKEMSKNSKIAENKVKNIVTALNAFNRFKNGVIIYPKEHIRRGHFGFTDEETKSLRIILAEYLNDDNKNTPVDICLKANDLYNKISSYLDRKFKIGN